MNSAKPGRLLSFNVQPQAVSTRNLGPGLAKKARTSTHLILHRHCNGKVKRGYCACSHRLSPHSFPCPWKSPQQLSWRTLEWLPPTVKSNGRKPFMSATWTPSSSSGLYSLEANTMRSRFSGIQAGVCQLLIWPLTGWSQAEAFHRPRSHPSPAHFSPPGCVRLNLRYACAAGAGREVGRLDSSVCHRRRLSFAALAALGLHCRR